MAEGSAATYLTVGEASAFLGISPWTLRGWDRAGKLVAKRHPQNGYRIYWREDLEALRPYGRGRADPSHRVRANELTRVGKSEHLVQFYETDAYLAESVAVFITSGLAAGDAGIIIATPEHRQAIAEAMSAPGSNAAPAVGEDRLVVLDAADTLASFMVNGEPDAARFREVVGGVLARVTRPTQGIRAFGEMVALLWAQGHRASAIRLEKLWNQLAKDYTFALLCGYPITGCGAADHVESFGHLCAQHARVIPAESYTNLASLDDRLRAITQLQQKARGLEAEIAHRAQVERDLAEREQELSEFLENATEGIHRVGPEGTILWANPAELELLGYEHDEFVGRPLADFHADPRVAQDMLARLTRGQAMRNQPATLRGKDGRLKHVLINSNGCFRDGRFLYSRCFTRDVTDRVLAGEADARLAAIVDSSDDAIVGKTLGGVITSWNQGARRLFGYTAQEAVGKPVMFLMPPGRQDEEPRILARLARGERVEHFETQRLTRDGRIIDVSLTISPILDAQGRVIGASKIARDITERKKTERASQEMNAVLERRVAQRTAELQAQSGRLRELAAEVSRVEQRERRTLSAMLHDGLAQTLAVGKLKLTMLEVQQPEVKTEPTFEAIKQTLVDAIHFTRTLMNDLSPPLLYDMGLPAAIEELAARMKDQHNLAVAFDADTRADAPEDLRAFLFQATREMLMNVVKYGQTHAATVAIHTSADHLAVTVEDRGAGFDLATLPDRPSQSRGFGLFNIRERAKLLGGTLEVESQPGRGTRCRLRVPLQPGPSPEACPGSTPASA